MADNEDIQTEDVSAGQPQQDAGTQAVDKKAGDDDGAGADAGAAAAEKDTTDYKSEYEKSQAAQKELQAKLTQTAQESARNKQLLSTLEPYIDYTRLHGGDSAGGNATAAGDADDDTQEEYVTSKQVKELVGSLSAKFKQELLAQNVRAKYPDVCDNGPNEVIVRHFLEKDTSPYETPEERIKSAVEKAREHIKSLKAEGRKEAETERAKTEAEAKVKAAAAAKASGLSASGTTSPSEAAEAPELTGESYVQQRRDRRAQTQTVAP